VTNISTVGITPIAIPTISRPEGLNPSAIKERKVSLLSIELSRERIRDLDGEYHRNIHTVAGVRTIMRARRDARERALRVRRLLLAR
jgi:hypothetical protein